jgi:hypothetical protein
MISKPLNVTDDFWQLCIDQRQMLMLKYPYLYYGCKTTIQPAKESPNQYPEARDGDELLSRDDTGGDRDRLRRFDCNPPPRLDAESGWLLGPI